MGIRTIDKLSPDSRLMILAVFAFLMIAGPALPQTKHTPQFTDSQLGELKKHLSDKYMGPITIDYDDRDHFLRVAYFQRGISKTLSSADIREFAEDRLSEVSLYIPINTSELIYKSLYRSKNPLLATFQQIKNSVLVHRAFCTVEVLTELRPDEVSVYCQYHKDAPAEPIAIDADNAIASAASELEKLQKKMYSAKQPKNMKGKPELIYFYPNHDPSVSHMLHLTYMVEYPEARYFVDAFSGKVVGFEQLLIP